jgi:DNA-binding transcriptional MerR regulator
MKENNKLLFEGNDLQDLYGFIKSDKEVAPIVSLLSDHSYLFDIDLSSRMLNYYESQGLLTFHRIGNGKRRFSFTNIISYKIAQHIKDSNNNNNNASAVPKLVQELNKVSRAGSSILNDCLALACILIGVRNLWVGFFFDAESSVFQILVTDKQKNGYFDLSNIVCEVILNKEAKMDFNSNSIKKSSFGYELSKLIDKLRQKSKHPAFISPNNSESNQNWKDRINDNSIKSIQKFYSQRPLNSLKREFDLLYLDGNDNLLGIAIQNIGSNYQDFRNNKIVSETIEELTEAFRREIEIHLRYLEKTNN